MIVALADVRVMSVAPLLRGLATTKGWMLAPIEATARRGHSDIDVPPNGRTDHMGVLSWIILGFVAGAIAKALHRGDEPTGLLATLFVGVLGALLGGFVASAVGIGSVSGFFSVGTWLIAIIGAFVLLVLYDAITSRSHGREPADPPRHSPGF